MYSQRSDHENDSMPSGEWHFEGEGNAYFLLFLDTSYYDSIILWSSISGIDIDILFWDSFDILILMWGRTMIIMQL